MDGVTESDQKNIPTAIRDADEIPNHTSVVQYYREF